MATIAILNKNGKETGKLELPDEIFGKRVNTAVIHQAVVMYQACLREGNASTKERGAVSGGGKKPFRQKGTGRARAGSTRSPLWEGGGVVFGPHPREYRYSIPKTMRRVALRESLNAKYQSSNLLCVEEFKDKFSKTKEFAKILLNLNLAGKTLGLLDGCDKSLQLVSRNIARFSLMRSDDVNAYDIMRNKNLIITKTAFTKLMERIGK